MKKNYHKNRVVLLVNLGTPETPSVGSVRRYLREFLMDKNVIDIPYFFRLLLVGGIIAPFRSFNSSKSYKEIWDKQSGSPLLSISEELRAKVEQTSGHRTYLAMRYGKPSIREGLAQALKYLGGKGEIFCIPLYPHHAMSTTASVLEKVTEELARFKKNDPKYKNITIHFKKAFYNDPLYLKALGETLKPTVKKMTAPSKKRPELLIFSYHGIPIRHLKKTDPTRNHCQQVENCCQVKNKEVHAHCYKHQCLQTTEAMIKAFKLDRKKVLTTFQSRLGRDPWIEPYTDLTVKQLAKDGVKRIAICSPAFVSDNLETLFELRVENKEFFIENGGEEFDVVPCLNTSPLWINTINSWIKDFK